MKRFEKANPGSDSETPKARRWTADRRSDLTLLCLPIELGIGLIYRLKAVEVHASFLYKKHTSTSLPLVSEVRAREREGEEVVTARARYEYMHSDALLGLD